MSYLPLSLGIGYVSGAEGGGRKPPSKSEIQKILKRDGHACRFCGFASRQYQRVVRHGDDFVTACSFCEQVLSLARAGMMGSGVLVWLPEITQAELNHVARAIYVARSEKDSDIAKMAERAMDALVARRTEAKKRLGSEDPIVLSTVLFENLNEKERHAAAKKLEGIRLLPFDKHMVRVNGKDIDGFPKIVEFWRSKEGPYGNLPVDSWLGLFEKASAVH